MIECPADGRSIYSNLVKQLIEDLEAEIESVQVEKEEMAKAAIWNRWKWQKQK